MEGSQPQQILESLKKLEPVVSSKFDALFILVHTILQDFGFKLVGLGEDGPCVEEKSLPSEWNRSSDSWAFRYRHSRSSMTFLVKGIRLQDKILLHAFAVEQKEVHNLDLDVDRYVNFTDFSLNNLPNAYKNVSELQKELEQSIVRKLVPSVEDLASRENTAGPPPRGPQPHAPLQPHPDRDPYYDPLRVPPTGSRYPGIPSVGGGDLYPDFGAYPGANPLPGAGGSLMGPNHPFFLGGGRGGYPYPGTPPGAPGGPGGVPGVHPPPPGARFDPYGPPGANTPWPRPDHLRPPDWDDSMFG